MAVLCTILLTQQPAAAAAAAAAASGHWPAGGQQQGGHHQPAHAALKGRVSQHCRAAGSSRHPTAGRTRHWRQQQRHQGRQGAGQQQQGRRPPAAAHWWWCCRGGRCSCCCWRRVCAQCGPAGGGRLCWRPVCVVAVQHAAGLGRARGGAQAGGQWPQRRGVGHVPGARARGPGAHERTRVHSRCARHHVSSSNDGRHTSAHPEACACAPARRL
jgi:hypothetical protein